MKEQPLWCKVRPWVPHRGQPPKIGKHREEVALRGGSQHYVVMEIAEPTKLAPAATTASSFDRGVHPSTRRAFSFDTSFATPSCGTICRISGTNGANIRTTQSGTSRVGAFLAAAPNPARSIVATSSSDTHFPATARNRSPFASGCTIARRCRSTTSRTSTTPKISRGHIGTFPSVIRFTISIDAATSLPKTGPACSTGPKIATGFTTASSSPPPSRSIKSHAARSASVFDFI
jgi:hypothetical protein